MVLLATLLISLQFPNWYIAKQMEYKSFALFSNEKLELTDAMKSVLDAVSINLKKSHFYQPNQQLELYFVKGSLYEQLVGLFGMKNIASSKFDKHIYIGKPDFENNILRKENNDYEWLNLVQIISHEGVHSQMYADYSNWGIMQTPSWINEGYAEYVSYAPIRNQTNYALSDVLKRYDQANETWIKTEYQSMTPRQYVRDRILVEYLMEEKGMNIVEIINDAALQPEDLLEEIKRYFGLIGSNFKY